MKLKTLIDNRIIPCASYAVLEDNDITKEYLGNIDGLNKKNTKDTLFDLASLTKLFTTTRILQLVEIDLLKLDDKVKIHLPKFKNNVITIQDCLIHKTGFIPSITGRHDMNREQIIESIMNIDDLKEENYNKTEYSCINFILLGLLIEEIDQVSLEYSFEKYIFEPLKMTHTCFNPPSASLCAPSEITVSRGTVKGLVHDETALNMGGVSGNAGLFSNLEDLIKFMQSYMNNTILRKSTIDNLFETNQSGRSLGWNIYSNAQVLYHTGFTGPVIVFDRENNRSLIILTNRTYPSRDNNVYLEEREKIINTFLKQ